MNTYKNVGAAVLLVGALALAWGALQNGSGTGAAAFLSSETIPIGGIMILSGEGASWGEASKNGMELAIAEINANGGVHGKKLRGIYEDDGSDPQKSISAFNKLTSADKVKFIIGPNWSNTGLAVAPLAHEAQVVMISPSLGLADFNESSPYLFNTWQHDDILSANLADIVFEKGYTSIALFGRKDVWTQAQTLAVKERFEELGGTVSLVYEPSPGTTDVRSEVQKVLAHPEIEAVVMTTDGSDLTVIMAKQLRDLGSTLPLFNITVDKHILAQCGTACDGMIFPTSLTPTQAFENAYRNAYDREVEIGSDSAYDAVMMIAEAMRETDSEDPEKVSAYLAGITEYDGASGLLTSDGKRGFTKGYLLYESRNGAPVRIEN